MAEFPALPLWTDAYLGDTTHLDTMEHGAYLLLLIVSWRTADTCLPDDDRILAKYARCGPKAWSKLRPILEPFFSIGNGKWIQFRLLEEKNFVIRRRDAAAENGRASALKRKERHSTKRPTKRDASDQRNSNELSTPTPTPTPNVEEDITSTEVVQNQGFELELDEPEKVPILKPEHVVETWNEVAGRIGKPKVRDFTDTRRQMVRARIGQRTLDEFRDVFAKVETTSFLREGGFCTFDWVMKQQNFLKIIEGNYDR